MRRMNHKRAHTTIGKATANRRAGDEKERLLAGLDTFVNAADSEEEYSKLQLQIPSFWPLPLRGPFGPNGLDQSLDWPAGGQLLFRAFRNYLRRLWRSDFYGDDGVMMDGRYLEYVLGLETRYTANPPEGFLDATLPDQAFRDGWVALQSKHKGAYCAGSADVLPQWRPSQFEYVSSNDFQRAVYLLLRESWRARVCRRCGRYFIADKAAQMFCSTPCSNRSKLEIGRRYWHEKGISLRDQRIKKPRTHPASGVRRSNMSGRPPKKGEPQ